jgi:hypothetical protein
MEEQKMKDRRGGAEKKELKVGKKGVGTEEETKK